MTRIEMTPPTTNYPTSLLINHQSSCIIVIILCLVAVAVVVAQFAAVPFAVFVVQSCFAAVVASLVGVRMHMFSSSQRDRVWL
jgi:hypothetical protein